MKNLIILLALIVGISIYFGMSDPAGSRAIAGMQVDVTTGATKKYKDKEKDSAPATLEKKDILDRAKKIDDTRSDKKLTDKEKEEALAKLAVKGLSFSLYCVMVESVKETDKNYRVTLEYKSSTTATYYTGSGGKQEKHTLPKERITVHATATDEIGKIKTGTHITLRGTFAAEPGHVFHKDNKEKTQACEISIQASDLTKK